MKVSDHVMGLVVATIVHCNRRETVWNVLRGVANDD